MSTDHVVVPQSFAETPCELGEHGVAEFVAVIVIHRLEVVDVKEEN